MQAEYNTPKRAKVLIKQFTEKILDFVEKFRVVELSVSKYINITASTDFTKDLSLELKLPLTSFFLDASQLNKVLNSVF